MNRALFLDRDGTVIHDRGYISNPSDVELLPGAAEALRGIQTAGWILIVVSNQSGVGRGLITSDQMDAVQRRFIELLAAERITIAASYFCVHSPEVACVCRKPSPYHLQLAAREHALDLTKSCMIGDRESDLLCGKNAGCRTIWLENPEFAVAPGLPDFVVTDWAGVTRLLD